MPQKQLNVPQEVLDEWHNTLEEDALEFRKQLEEAYAKLEDPQEQVQTKLLEYTAHEYQPGHHPNQYVKGKPKSTAILTPGEVFDADYVKAAKKAFNLTVAAQKTPTKQAIDDAMEAQTEAQKEAYKISFNAAAKTHGEAIDFLKTLLDQTPASAPAPVPKPALEMPNKELIDFLAGPKAPPAEGSAEFIALMDKNTYLKAVDKAEKLTKQALETKNKEDFAKALEAESDAFNKASNAEQTAIKKSEKLHFKNLAKEHLANYTELNDQAKKAKSEADTKAESFDWKAGDLVKWYSLSGSIHTGTVNSDTPTNYQKELLDKAEHVVGEKTKYVPVLDDQALGYTIIPAKDLILLKRPDKEEQGTTPKAKPKPNPVPVEIGDKVTFNVGGTDFFGEVWSRGEDSGEPGKMGISSPAYPGGVFIDNKALEKLSGTPTRSEPIELQSRIGSGRYSASMSEEEHKLSTTFDIDDYKETPQETKHRIVTEIADRLKDNDAFNKYAVTSVGPFETMEEYKTEIARDPEYYKDVTLDKLRYQAANQLIATWAHTSSDSDSMSITLQYAVKDEFDLKDAVVNHFEGGPQVDKEALPAMRAFAREMYNNTQEFLKKNDIKYMEVFRGMNFDTQSDVEDAGLPRVAETKFEREDHIADVAQQPAASWAYTVNSAAGFATGSTNNGSYGVLMAAKIPASRILGTCMTGLGCKIESEVVLLGGKDRVTATSFDIENAFYNS